MSCIVGASVQQYIEEILSHM